MRLRLPAGWTAREFRASEHLATLHAGDFTLAEPDGEFGERSTAQMPEVASFVALVEYLPGSGHQGGRGLFRAAGLPLPLDPTRFTAAARPGQVAMRHLFTAAGRPFCLYVVLAGPRLGRRRQLLTLDHALGSFEPDERVET